MTAFFGAHRRAVRLGLIAFTVLDLVALLGLAVHRTTRVTTFLTSAPSAPAAAPAAAPTSQPAQLVTTVVSGGGGPVQPIVVATQAPSAPAPAVTTPAAPTPSTTPITIPTGPTEAPPTPCPIALATPAESGGLQSLITFAPAFGPFTAEAFAAAAAYQPALELIGPILAQYPKLAPTVEPIIDPLLTELEAGENVGYGIIGPSYASYRPQVLATESALATALAPYSQSLASSALGGCVVDLEAALVGDTNSSSGTQSSGGKS